MPTGTEQRSRGRPFRRLLLRISLGRLCGSIVNFYEYIVRQIVGEPTPESTPSPPPPALPQEPSPSVSGTERVVRKCKKAVANTTKFLQSPVSRESRLRNRRSRSAE